GSHASVSTAGAATNVTRDATRAIEAGVTQVEALPGEIAGLPFLQSLSQVFPAADLAVGGAILMLIMLIHAAGVRFVTSHVVRRSRNILLHPTSWRADLLMSGTVLLLLALHLIEMLVWTTALVKLSLIPAWRVAGFFAANTYTTVGYGSFVLPPAWAMLAPIIAMSGLFTFGWSGSVLVDLVGRCQQIKDAAASGKTKVGRAIPATKP
ncbi:MAG: ion channel, partial [Burkholderiaceae bacterium]